jgi:hypothetical protein
MVLDTVKKIYISGKISGNSNFSEYFGKVEAKLKDLGYVVLNPASMPKGLTQREYMKISVSMLDCCDAIVLLDNWKESEGAVIEKLYAEKIGLVILDEKDF